MKSSSEPSQSQKPLDGKSPNQTPSKETWHQYGPNPRMELNNEGKLRTKPINPDSTDPWAFTGKRG